MLIPDRALQLLVDAGVTVLAQESDNHGDRGVDLVVTAPGWQGVRALRVKRYSRPVSPGALTKLAARRAPEPSGLLVITPSASSKVRELAVDLGISLIALNSDRVSGPDGHLAFGPGDVTPLGRVHAEPSRSPSQHGRKPWGTSLVLRTILLGAGRMQREIAELARVSQPRVSQILNDLTRERLVERRRSAVGLDLVTSRHWQIRDWDGLVLRWLDQYPGPGGVTTFWYGLETPHRQASAVVELLSSRNGLAERAVPPQRQGGDPDEATEVLVSGDVAADLLAPWARPRQAVVYARRGADLSILGLTPSPAEQSTLALVVPEDPGVWALAGRISSHRDRNGDDFPLADPLQVLWDLRQSPGPDADQAAAHFTTWLRDHFGQPT